MGCGSSSTAAIGVDGGSVNRVHPTTYKGPRCTFATTGSQFISQRVYACHTCKMDRDAVFCENCLISCHANCRTSEKGTQSAYCDCGMRGQTQCICVAPLSSTSGGGTAATSSPKPPAATPNSVPVGPMAAAATPVKAIPSPARPPAASSPTVQAQTSSPPAAKPIEAAAPKPVSKPVAASEPPAKAASSQPTPAPAAKTSVENVKASTPVPTLTPSASSTKVAEQKAEEPSKPKPKAFAAVATVTTNAPIFTPQDETSKQDRFRADVLILRNDECMSLADRLAASLQAELYAVETVDEAELAKSAAKLDVLDGIRKVLWILTSGVWEQTGTINAVATAHRRGIDVVLVRQDGALWNGLNFPSYASIPPSVSGVFSNKAIEHVTPFYSAFLLKLVDRLQAPRVCVWQHLRAELDTKVRNNKLTAWLQTKPKSDDEADVEHYVAQTMLLINEWLHLDEKSTKDQNSKDASYGALVQPLLQFNRFFSPPPPSNAEPMQMDDVEVALQGKDSTSEAASSSGKTQLSRALIHKGKSFSSVLALLARAAARADAPIPALQSLDSVNSITKLLNYYALDSEEPSAAEKEAAAQIAQHGWAVMQGLIQSLGAPAAEAFSKVGGNGVLVHAMVQLVPTGEAVTAAGVSLLSTLVSTGGSAAFLASCAPTYPTSAAASATIASALIGAAGRYKSNQTLLDQSKVILSAVHPQSSKDLEASAAASVRASATSAAAGVKKEHDFFLSHRQIDAQDMVKRLKLELENRGYTAFLDRDDAGFLADLPAIVRASRIFLFVLSPSIFRSIWCCQELMAAIDSPSTRILLVKQEGTKWYDAAGMECESVDEFPPEELLSDQVKPYVAKLRVEAAAAANEVQRTGSLFSSNRVSPVIPHSSFYFPQFFQSVLTAAGQPVMRVEARVNEERALEDNVASIASLLPVGVKGAGTDAPKGISLLVACAEKLKLILTARSQAKEWSSAAVEERTWRSLVVALTRAIEHVLYGVQLASAERWRSIEILLDLLAVAISLNRTVLLDECLNLAEVDKTSCSDSLPKLLDSLLQDSMDEPQIQASCFDVIRSAYAGSAKDVDSVTRWNTFILANTNLLKQFCGILHELHAGIPAHVLSRLALGRLKPQQASDNEGGEKLDDKAEELLLKQLARRRAKALSKAEEELKSQRKALEDRARSSAAALLAQWSSVDGKTQAALFAELARNGFGSFIANESPVFASNPQALQLVRSSWGSANAAAAVSLPLLRPNHMTFPAAKEFTNATRNEYTCYVLHDPNDVKANALVRGLQMHLRSNLECEVRIEAEKMREVQATQRSTIKTYMLILSERVLESPVNRQWLANKELGHVCVVLMDDVKWMSDGPDGTTIVSKFPPVNQMALPWRAHVIQHSVEFYADFMQRVEQGAWQTSKGGGIISEIHYHEALPELIALMQCVSSQSIDSRNTRTFYLLNWFARISETSWYHDVRNAIFRGLDPQLWLTLQRLLLHRLLTTQAMPDTTPGKQDHLLLLIKVLDVIAPAEPDETRESMSAEVMLPQPYYLNAMRRSDKLELQAFLRTIYELRNTLDLKMFGSSFLCRLLGWNPGHEHPLDPSDKPLREDTYGTGVTCIQCGRHEHFYRARRYICSVEDGCKKKNHGAGATICGRCVELTPNAQSALALRHKCSAAGPAQGHIGMTRKIGVKKCGVAGCTRLERKFVAKKDVYNRDYDSDRMWLKLLMEFSQLAISSGYECETCKYAECSYCYEQLHREQAADNYFAKERARAALCNETLLNYCAELLSHEGDAQFWNKVREFKEHVFISLIVALEYNTELRARGQLLRSRIEWGKTQHGWVKELMYPRLARMLDEKADTKVPPATFIPFPYMLVYDRSDADVARSVQLSMAASTGLQAGSVWDEDVPGDYKEIATTANRVVVLLSTNSFENPYMCDVMTRVLTSPTPHRLVIVKLDGVTWRQQLYPQMDQIPPTLRAFFSETIQRSVDHVEGKVQRSSIQKGPDPLLMLRYCRDYFADFYTSLFERLQIVVSLSSANPFASYFREASFMHENVTALARLLQDAPRMMALTRQWSDPQAVTAAAASGSSGWNKDVAAFQRRVVAAFNSIYPSSSHLLANSPDRVPIRAWERLLIQLCSLLTASTEQLRVEKKAQVRADLHSHVATYVDLIGTLAAAPSVAPLIKDPLVKSDAPSVASKTLALATNIDESSFPAFGTSVHAALRSVAQLARDGNEWEQLFNLLSLLASSPLLPAPTAYHPIAPPHPATPFSTYAAAVRTARWDRFTVELLQLLHKPGSFMLPKDSAARHNSCLLPLYTLLSGLIRANLFDCTELMLPLSQLILFDLASFQPEQNHSIAWLIAASECLGCAVRANTGVSIADVGQVDEVQLVALLFAQLTRIIHTNIAAGVSLSFALSQLAFYSPTSRAPLRTHGFVELAQQWWTAGKDLTPSWIDYFFIDIISSLLVEGDTPRSAVRSWEVNNRFKSSSMVALVARNTSLLANIKARGKFDAAPASADGPFGGHQVRVLVLDASEEFEELSKNLGDETLMVDAMPQTAQKTVNPVTGLSNITGTITIRGQKYVNGKPEIPDKPKQEIPTKIVVCGNEIPPEAIAVLDAQSLKLLLAQADHPDGTPKTPDEIVKAIAAASEESEAASSSSSIGAPPPPPPGPPPNLSKTYKAAQPAKPRVQNPLPHGHVLRAKTHTGHCNVCGEWIDRKWAMACSQSGCGNYVECSTCHVMVSGPMQPHAHTLTLYTANSQTDLHSNQQVGMACNVCGVNCFATNWTCNHPECTTYDEYGVKARYAECRSCFPFVSGQSVQKNIQNGLQQLAAAAEKAVNTIPNLGSLCAAGIFYAELKIDSLSPGAILSVGMGSDHYPLERQDSVTFGTPVGSWIGTLGFVSAGHLLQYGSIEIAYGAADHKPRPWKSGDIIGFLVDARSKTVQFTINGSTENCPPIKPTQDSWQLVTRSPTFVTIAAYTTASGQTVKATLNCGEAPFTYATMNEARSRTRLNVNSLKTGRRTAHPSLKVSGDSTFEFSHPVNSTGGAFAVLQSSKAFMHEGLVIDAESDLRSAGSEGEWQKQLASAKRPAVKSSSSTILSLPVKLENVSVAQPISAPLNVKAKPRSPARSRFTYFEVALLALPEGVQINNLELHIGFTPGIEDSWGSVIGKGYHEIGLAVASYYGPEFYLGSYRSDALKPSPIPAKEALEKGGPVAAQDVFGVGFYTGDAAGAGKKVIFTRNGNVLFEVSEEHLTHRDLSSYFNLRSAERFYGSIGIGKVGNAKSPLKLRANFGQFEFAYKIPAEYGYVPRDDLVLIADHGLSKDSIQVKKNRLGFEVTNEGYYSKPLRIYSEQPMLVERQAANPDWTAFSVEKSLSTLPTPDAGMSDLLYYEVEILKTSNDSQRLSGGAELCLLMRTKEWNQENTTWEYGHSGNFIAWETQYGGLRYAHEGDNSQTISVGRVGRPVTKGDVVGMGYIVTTSTLLCTLNGAVVHELQVPSQWFSGTSTYFRVGLVTDTGVRFNMGHSDFKWAPANGRILKRTDINMDLMGGGLKVSGNEFECNTGTHFSSSTPLASRGRILRGKSSDDKDELAGAIIQFELPDAARDSVLRKHATAMTAWASANQFDSGKAAPLKPMSLDQANQIWQALQVFSAAVQGRAYSAGRFPNRTHAHALSRTVPAGGWSCSLCSTKSTGGKAVAFSCAGSCEWKECGACFLLHSSLSQPHVHRLVKSQAPQGTSCFFCAAVVSGASLGCALCAVYCCTSCEGKRSSVLAIVQRDRSLKTDAKAADDFDKYVTNLYFRETKQVRPANYPFKPFSDEERKKICIKSGTQTLSWTQTHAHDLTIVKNQTQQFTCVQCNQTKTSTYLYCDQLGCNGWVCCLRCANPGQFKNGASTTYTAGCHSHLCAIGDCGDFTCQVCCKPGKGYGYKCPTCSQFSAHTMCAGYMQMPFLEKLDCNHTRATFGQSAQLAVHPHKLIYSATIGKGVYECNKCQQWGAFTGWYCAECDIAIHPQCSGFDS